MIVCIVYLDSQALRIKYCKMSVVCNIVDKNLILNLPQDTTIFQWWIWLRRIPLHVLFPHAELLVFSTLCLL
jgi:hypothetical protein